MWEIIKTQGIKTKEKNTWVYEAAGDNVLGVELDNRAETGRLEVRIQLDKYAYYKHTGSYKLIQGRPGRLWRNEHQTRL